MNIAKYLILLGICAGLCWLAWFFVLFFISPASGWFAILFFYAALLCALLGTFSIIIFIIRLISRPDEPSHYHIQGATWQAIPLGILIAVALILQRVNYLKWWSIIIIIFAGVLVEIIIATRQKH